MYLSIVAPLYNEEGNVRELHKQIKKACDDLGQSYEIIFVDDGSSDGTIKDCEGLSPLNLVILRKNFGQTAAMDAGIKQARGEIIITMDGDLQNDPADMKLLLDKMNEGYDIVSGWRYKRKDSFSKKFLSRGANLLRKMLIDDGIHDSGCSLKAYKRECFENVDLFGEMHRFIPAILKLDGFRAGEVKVNHRPRVNGVTKYNWKRVLKGFVDMVSVWFWRKYAHRPLHLFGGGGIIFSVAGVLIILWMVAERIFFDKPISERIWPLMGVFLIMIGVQLFIFGLLSDIVVKNYYKTRGTMNYSVREVREQ